jgi:hypothetical protein
MSAPTPGTLNMVETRIYLHSLRDRLPMFVITDHPTDWPEFYVARLHLTLPEDALLPFAIMDPSLDRLRDTMEALGLVCLSRDPLDHPAIVETWL